MDGAMPRRDLYLWEVNMPPWRKTAKAMLPELARRVDEADNPYLLWFDIFYAFEQAYESKPRNESLIRRIYQYAYWSDQQPRGKTAHDDLLTIVGVCFYEHIPRHAKSRQDMPRWFTLKEFETAKAMFSYLLEPAEVRALHKHFKAHQNRYQAGLRTQDRLAK
jgi:hypothetical protein